ncbi:uncharacterized protein EV422DRAFT_569300 [Fimicolochytrium jonesii]|uniref:uncharacterized protein n=1 Tax=Fimicolochytrium jonesii TaxID=1396493 RepID=UPI0022FE7F72|nr:uncharacterized protein EV422DRAFT_569300 [Fimicolochytrium jonesii]KAI8819022.1 hypothetical protein EV422DRAFT_569300 [Fimicolochytrium jonesii]
MHFLATIASIFFAVSCVVAQAPLGDWTGVLSVTGAAVFLDATVQDLTPTFPRADVVLEWSVDDWKTSVNVAGTPVQASKTWKWHAPITTLDKPLPQTVKFFIRYNNIYNIGNKPDGSLILRIAPAASCGDIFSTGIVTIGCTFNTDLPLTNARGRVDQGPTSPSGVYPGPEYRLNTSTLANGQHTFTVQADLGSKKPFVTKSVPFTVANRVRSLGTWKPMPPPQAQAIASMAVGKDGKLYVGWDNTKITRYASFGAAAYDVVYDFGAQYRPVEVRADETGNVFAVHGTTIYKWLANGTPDAAFANKGQLDLTKGPYPLPFFQQPIDLYVEAGFVYVAGPDGNLLRFNAKTGAFGAALKFTRSSPSSFSSLRGTLYGLGGNILYTIDETTFKVVSQKTIAMQNQPQGISVAATRLYVFDYTQTAYYTAGAVSIYDIKSGAKLTDYHVGATGSTSVVTLADKTVLAADTTSIFKLTQNLF